MFCSRKVDPVREECSLTSQCGPIIYAKGTRPWESNFVRNQILLFRSDPEQCGADRHHALEMSVPSHPLPTGGYVCRICKHTPCPPWPHRIRSRLYLSTWSHRWQWTQAVLLLRYVSVSRNSLFPPPIPSQIPYSRCSFQWAFTDLRRTGCFQPRCDWTAGRKRGHWRRRVRPQPFISRSDKPAEEGEQQQFSASSSPLWTQLRHPESSSSPW